MASGGPHRYLIIIINKFLKTLILYRFLTYPTHVLSLHASSTADGTNTKWSQCSYCKLVITSVNLWRHVRTQHTAQQPQVCQYCQKNFKNKYSLREHIRIAHEKLTRDSSETQASGKDDDMGSTTETEMVVLKAEK